MVRRQLSAARRRTLDKAVLLGLIATIYGLVAFGIYDSWVHYHPVYSLQHDAALKAPKSYRAQLNASEKFIEQRRWAFALAYAHRAVSIHPERASGWINASTAAGGLRAWPLAYNYLKRAFDIHPDRQLAENLVYVCRVLGKAEEAAAYENMLPQLDANLQLKEPTL